MKEFISITITVYFSLFVLSDYFALARSVYPEDMACDKYFWTGPAAPYNWSLDWPLPNLIHSMVIGEDSGFPIWIDNGLVSAYSYRGLSLLYVWKDFDGNYHYVPYYGPVNFTGDWEPLGTYVNPDDVTSVLSADDVGPFECPSDKKNFGSTCSNSEFR